MKQIKLFEFFNDSNRTNSDIFILNSIRFYSSKNSNNLNDLDLRKEKSFLENETIDNISLGVDELTEEDLFGVEDLSKSSKEKNKFEEYLNKLDEDNLCFKDILNLYHNHYKTQIIFKFILGQKMKDLSVDELNYFNSLNKKDLWTLLKKQQLIEFIIKDENFDISQYPNINFITKELDK